MASSLAAVLGKLLAMVFVTHHSDALAPEQCHLFQPTGTIKAQNQAKPSKTKDTHLFEPAIA
ncbi:hypothetical protein [Aeromonas sp. Marseille-Q5825]|uniref:hypothetical protein n=1 Tax=Aeromonas sp. Marseille-Q5825 TaxID=2972767 RepID=UPI0021CA8270|nr:hypothetical protein [Aeromonas sp. Marseille-Q5825]